MYSCGIDEGMLLECTPYTPLRHFRTWDRPKGPPINSRLLGWVLNSLRYVENLEQRLEKMERLLKSLGVDVPEASEEPDVDISKLGDNSGDLPRNDNDDILGLQVKVQNMSIGQPVSKPFFGRSR